MECKSLGNFFQTMRIVFKGFLGVFAERCECTDLQSFKIFCPFVTNLRFSSSKRSLRLGLSSSSGLEDHVEKGIKTFFYGQAEFLEPQ